MDIPTFLDDIILGYVIPVITVTGSLVNSSNV